MSIGKNVGIKGLYANGRLVKYLVTDKSEKELTDFYNSFTLEEIANDYKQMSELFTLKKYEEGHVVADKMKNKYGISITYIFVTIGIKKESWSLSIPSELFEGYNILTHKDSRYSIIGNEDRGELWVLPTGVLFQVKDELTKNNPEVVVFNKSL